MKKKSQKQQVLDYLTRCTKKGLSQMEAAEKFGVWRLGAVIYALEKDGYSFRHTSEKNKSNNGNHSRYFLG